MINILIQLTNHFHLMSYSSQGALAHCRRRQTLKAEQQNRSKTTILLSTGKSKQAVIISVRTMNLLLPYANTSYVEWLTCTSNNQHRHSHRLRIRGS